MSRLNDLLGEENVQGIGRYFLENSYDLQRVSEEFGESSREYELYERYLAEISFASRKHVEKSKERGFKIRGYEHAEQILDWPQNERALRTLVYDVTGDSDLAEYLNYRGLRHQYHRIKGVAQKILKSKK